MNNKKKEIILSVFGVLSLVVLTIGITYAVFTYTRLGTTENTITTGTLKFLYTENTGVGNGINISNALPVSDDIGKNYSNDSQVFDFKVEATNTSNEPIPYTITLRKKLTSTLPEDAVKVYLTDMTENADVALVEPIKYMKLGLLTTDQAEVEKVLYNDNVDAGETNYLKEYRLRMWIDENVNFGGEYGEYYMGKTFTATVNIYANATVVDLPEEKETMTSANTLSIGQSVTAVDGSKWHVLENSAGGVENVTLLSDYNLNSDGTYNTSCQGVEGNASSYYCSGIAYDSDNTQNYDETDSNNIGYFIKNTYESNVLATLPGTTNITLPTADQIAKANSLSFSQTSLTLTESWLLTTVYWTKTETTLDTGTVWYVDGHNSKLDFDSANGSLGLKGARPVITTPKTNLLAS